MSCFDFLCILLFFFCICQMLSCELVIQPLKELVFSLSSLQDFTTVEEGSCWSSDPRSASIQFNRRRAAETPPVPRVPGGSTQPGGVLTGYRV